MRPGFCLSQVDMPGAWDPEQYRRFRAERSEPFFDLLALVRPHPQMRILDLGCGTGELTRVLHERLQAADTIGVDRSQSMLAESGAFAGDGVRFELADLRDFAPRQPVDVVFSNAALHWVPNHEDLFSRLIGWLASGGQLAIQVPANHDHPSHVVAAEVAREEPFRSALDGYVRDSPVLAPEAYAALLDSLGCSQQHVRVQVYPHRLESREAVIEWNKGALLTAYRERLPEAIYGRFLTRYRERLLPRLEDRRPFFYGYKRLLLWAQR